MAIGVVVACDLLRVQGGLVFKAHRLVYHSTLGLRVIKKKNKKKGGTRWCRDLSNLEPYATSQTMSRSAAGIGGIGICGYLLEIASNVARMHTRQTRTGSTNYFAEM